MQRRKVDLPEPDGPTRTSTWPRSSSSVTPFRTLRAPKSLQTCSAFTMGVISSHPRVLELRLGQRLELFGRQLAGRATREVPLQVELADHEDAGDQQIP